MKLIRQCAAIALTSGVAVASLSAPAVAGHTTKNPTTSDPSQAAASYLAGQLATSGKYKNLLTTKFKGTTYPDYGDSADAVLSLTASGSYGHRDRNMANALEKDAAKYTLYFGGAAPDYYPGGIAKLLLVAEALHLDPESFGGLDLIGILAADEGAGDAAPGQYQNAADPDFGSNVISQALAVLALSNSIDSGDQPSSAAVNFLAGQQCGDGSFQVDIRPGGSDCKADSGDVDATAYAIQGLLAAGDHGDAKTAMTWLLGKEKKDGGWTETTGKSNANSTAIAVEALIAAHRDPSDGQQWLVDAQIGCGNPAGQRGAVAFNGGKYSAGTDIKATSQAGVALAGKSLAQVDTFGSTNAEPVLACKKK